jgi:hypothetical protein
MHQACARGASVASVAPQPGPQSCRTGRVAVIIEQYASSRGWLAHSANLEPLMRRLAQLCEFTEVEVYGDQTPEARASLDAVDAR